LALAVAAVAQNYTIQTFAGGVLPENMPALSASLGGVSGVAIDRGGNVLIALSDYNIVVRLDQASGNLTRVAGNGVKGFAGDNGPATQAELSGPTGIAVFPNLAVSDIGIGYTLEAFVGPTSLGISVPFNIIGPTTFFVTSNLDSGPGTLRQAILDANANAPAYDVIDFEELNSEVITLTTPLPAITDPVHLDGHTWPFATHV